MEFSFFNDISPWVRLLKVQKASFLSGEWMDFDNVFTYIAEGEADFILDGIRYHLKKGDVLIMPPFQKHIISTTSDSPLVQFIIHFDLYYNEQRAKIKEVGMDCCNKNIDISDKEMHFSKNFFFAHLGQAERFTLENKFYLMNKEFIQKSQGYEMNLKAFVTELIALFLRNICRPAGELKNITRSWAVIERTINFINNNYSEESLDNYAISKAVGVTPNYLCQIFSEQLGIPVHRYLNHVRIENAKKLLKEGATITAVAEQVGFSGIHVFSKIFKKIVLMTPSNYIAGNQKVNMKISAS